MAGHFPGDNFECIFFNENISISIKIPLKFFFGSDYGLVPTRWQAIIWTNDGNFTQEYMHHSASIG